MNDEHKRKIAEALRVSWTPERREAMRQQRMGSLNPFFGKVHPNRKEPTQPIHVPRGRYAYRAFGISDDECKQHKAKGERFCCSCRTWKPLAEFRGGWCSPCTQNYIRNKNANDPTYKERRLAEYQRNASLYKQRAKEYRMQLSAEDRQALARKNKLRRYGVSPQWYDEQLAQQGGVCAICGNHTPSGKYGKYMYVDHNHETGKARGILCNGCNTGIAWLEKTEWRAKAEAYLNVYRSSAS